MTDPTGLWFVGLRPQRQPHPEFGYRYGCRPNAHAAQAGLPSYSSCGLRGHADTRKRALGAAGEHGRRGLVALLCYENKRKLTRQRTPGKEETGASRRKVSK